MKVGDFLTDRLSRTLIHAARILDMIADRLRGLIHNPQLIQGLCFETGQ
jgi:hypothetical protein